MSTNAELKRTAIHEAGHAVVQIVLDLGCKTVSIEPDDESAGRSTHGGEWGRQPTKPGEEDDDTATLRLFAEGEFWLRHAVADHAGAEAVRRSGYPLWFEGADTDYRNAGDALDHVTGDEWSRDLLGLLAKRRCQVLVEHYWPEIQAIAKKLLRSRTIDGETARRFWSKSLTSRGGALRKW